MNQVVRRVFPRRVAVSAGLVLVVLLGITAPGGVAIGASVGVGGIQEAGVLRLQLGSSDRWVFEPADAGTDISQPISGSGQCGVNQSGWTLASLSSSRSTKSPNFPGFVADAFGVGGKGQEGNGTPCGRVDPGQALSMSLGSGLSGTLIDFAEVDLEAKFGVTLRIERYLDGDLVGFEELDPSDLQDDGPDSGDGDNYRVRVPATGTSAFDEIVVKPAGTEGALSLEGGADGTAPLLGGLADLELGDTTDSVFHLVEADGVLGCDPSNNTAEEGGNGAPFAQIVRVANADGSTCQLVLYSLESTIQGGVQFVTFRKDLTNQPQARFLWTTTWEMESAQMPVPATQISYEDAEGFHDMKWCLADGTTGPVDGYPDLPPRNAGYSGTEFWCITSQHSDLNEDTGQIEVTEDSFGFADPIKRR